MTCGGLNGWPMTVRSGRLHFAWMTLIVMPDELEAMIASGGVASSRSEVNFRRCGEAPGASPSIVTPSHAPSTYDRSAASAPGAGSVAVTSKAWARKCVAQLAPMVPVPTIATRCTSSFENICYSFYFGWSSAPAPDGCTLFGEGHCAFVCVLGVEQAECVLALQFERFDVVEALGFSQDVLDLAQCERGVDRDASGKVLRPCQGGTGLGQLADEPVLLGVDGRERLAGEQHLEGDVVRDSPGQADDATL